MAAYLGRVGVVALVMGVLAAGLGAAPDGSAERPAAAPFPRIDQAELDTFRLTAGDSFATYGARVEALERQPQLTPNGVSDVLATANRHGRPLCHETHLEADLAPEGFCWQDGEDDDANVWIPQGVSGSGDADPRTGTVDGRRITVTTWHTQGDEFIRVTLTDVTEGSDLRYRHLLLVEPTSDDDFAAVPGHGHGITWIGDRLFVAAYGSLIRVFDLTHVWPMDTGTEEVGRGTDGKYHARYHAWALPQVGAYRYVDGQGCEQLTGANPCMASLAQDHSGDGSLIAAEHIARGGDGRIVRWPLDPATGRLKAGADGEIAASEGFRSPVWAMQGAVAVDGYFAITGMCPEHADDPPADRPSCLHGGVGGEATERLGQAPVNSQNLSHWPATDELWLLNEQLRERVNLHIDWSALTGR